MPYATFQNKGTASGGTGGSVTPTYPATPSANDIFLLAVLSYSSGGTTISTPAGWSVVDNVTFEDDSNNEDGSAAVFYKISDGTETGTVTVSKTGATGAGTVMFAQMYRYSDVEIGNPVERITFTDNNGGSTVTFGSSGSFARSGRTIIAITLQTSTTATTTPTSYTNRAADSDASGIGAYLRLDDYEDRASVSATSASNGNALGNVGAHFALRPDAPLIRSFIVN